MLLQKNAFLVEVSLLCYVLEVLVVSYAELVIKQDQRKLVGKCIENG